MSVTILMFYLWVIEVCIYADLIFGIIVAIILSLMYLSMIRQIADFMRYDL